jgi:fluoride exporter
LVLVGGGLGAMLREFVMLMVPNPVDGFPLDILVANLLAAFLLGLVTALHRRQVLSDDVNMLLGAGIMGGMSSFSSFVYGSVVLIRASAESAVVASVYVVVSLALGCDYCRGKARRTRRHVGKCCGGGRRMSLARLLSRVQLGFTVSFQIIFPAFTVGLAAWQSADFA